ncbi:MFS transporter [Aestuariivirga sp. YIM B02566]|uniref:MFS transporter n=1 Tax=Taklimakanibacter albus TaxID=2800327 RepID=A0ACC5QXF9_9HYPH|nr:MFS transporter [Aestuariivirga sp. YIM B02566]MBK1865050.1 MFS transporter [Aestuariivirga sp. YIM B02566]
MTTAQAAQVSSTRLVQFLAARGIHYGWVVAATTFLTMLATAGAMGSAGVMIEPLQKEFGWSTADISFAFAVRLVLFGLMGPFAAAFMNQFGIRRVVSVALGLIAVGLIGSCFMTEIWQLVLLWGVVVGFGTGMTALVLGATVAARWFTARRGLVVGMMTASNATGQLVFLPLMASLAEAFGWRAALGFVLVILALAFILVALLMRDRPSDVGLAAYGDVAESAPTRPNGSLAQMLVSPLLALREAARTQTFWVLFLTFFVCGLSTNGLIQTHWIALCGDFGVAPVGAAGMLAVIGLFDFAGTIFSGWLSDRYDNRWLLFWFYGLRGLSLIYLPFSDFSVFALSIFAVIYGLDWVATVPPTVKLAAERFGAERAGLVFGWVFTGHQLGAAVAAFGAGATRTLFDTYMPALFVSGAFCILASLLVMSLSRSVQPRAVAA